MRGKLFHQFLELFSLLGCQDRANFLVHILNCQVHLGRDQLPQITVAFLAIGDDFSHLLTLFRREVQSRIQLPDKLLVQHLRAGQWQFLGAGTVPVRRAGRAVDFRMRTFYIIDEQSTRHDAATKNHDRGQNDFPGIH